MKHFAFKALLSFQCHSVLWEPAKYTSERYQTSPLQLEFHSSCSSTAQDSRW